MSIIKKSSVLILSIAVVVVMTGCDKIMPKPKKVVKPVVSAEVKAPVVAAAAVVASPAEAKVVEKESKVEPLPANVLAKVGDWSITIEEFNDRMDGLKKNLKEFDSEAPNAKAMVLDDIIRQQLLVYEAQQQKIDQMADIKAAVKDFENVLLVQEIAGRLTEGVVATEEEAKQYYDANPDVFIMPVERQLREIVVASEAEAKEIMVLLLQGADFAQTAKDRSKGKNAAEGGDLGFVIQAPLEAMQKEIASLKKGELSRVFQGPEGYYIVKVEDVRGGDKKALEEIKDDLIKGLTQQKQQQAVLLKMSEVAQKVNIQVNEDLLK